VPLISLLMDSLWINVYKGSKIEAKSIENAESSYPLQA
jgi:hypothetical protein